MKFEIKGLDDEDIEFLIDGRTISYANHDDDGWHGMEKLTNMFEEIADALGEEVVRTEQEYKMSEYRTLTLVSSTGSISSYMVTNEPADWRREDKWPCVAEFHVGVGYSVEDQRRRANEYADYMNRGKQVDWPY